MYRGKPRASCPRLRRHRIFDANSKPPSLAARRSGRSRPAARTKHLAFSRTGWWHKEQLSRVVSKFQQLRPPIQVVVLTTGRTLPMIIQTLAAIAISTASLSSQPLARQHTALQKPVHALRHYRGSHNQTREPAFAGPRAPATGTYFDRSFDPSRIGGRDPNFNPSPT